MNIEHNNSQILFDKVYCVSNCKNIKYQKNICNIMNYLNIKFEFIYGADMYNIKALKSDKFKFEPFLNKDKEDFKKYTNYISTSYDHYTAIIHAYESGANSVLIIKDDCNFIGNRGYILKYLNEYPKDADFIKFGYINWNDIKKITTNKEGHYFLNNDEFNFKGSQLYGICNRETMKKYIDSQQENFKYCDNMYSLENTITYGLINPLAVDNDTTINNNENINMFNLLRSY